MYYLFVGEERSKRAIKLGLTWADGGLAAKPLFEALRACNVNPADCQFTNWFERGGKVAVTRAQDEGRVVVALGKKVSKALTERRITHLKLVHPAARGRIRKRERYVAHVKEKLV